MREKSSYYFISPSFHKRKQLLYDYFIFIEFTDILIKIT